MCLAAWVCLDFLGTMDCNWECQPNQAFSPHAASQDVPRATRKKHEAVALRLLAWEIWGDIKSTTTKVGIQEGPVPHPCGGRGVLSSCVWSTAESWKWSEVSSERESSVDRGLLWKEGGKAEIPNKKDKPESHTKGMRGGVKKTTKRYYGSKTSWKNTSTQRARSCRWEMKGEGRLIALKREGGEGASLWSLGIHKYCLHFIHL